jgi:hypothetical protein
MFRYYFACERTEVNNDKQSHFIGKMIVQIAIIMTGL